METGTHRLERLGAGAVAVTARLGVTIADADELAIYVIERGVYRVLNPFLGS
jgi:hypothetical protein